MPMYRASIKVIPKRNIGVTHGLLSGWIFHFMSDQLEMIVCSGETTEEAETGLYQWVLENPGHFIFPGKTEAVPYSPFGRFLAEDA